MKKVWIIFLVLLVIFFGWFLLKPKSLEINLDQLKDEKPDLAYLIDEIQKWQAEVAKDDTNVGYYSSLGLSWKGLADMEFSKKSENYKIYYQKALESYEKAIDLTKRQNSLFLSNAGNMAKYLENYELAEEYYKESISVDPGNKVYYVSLAELYEYRMNKTKEEIMAVYEEGKENIIDPNFLEEREETFLERWEEK